MRNPRPRQPLLSPQALQGLRHAKQQIMDAAVGRIPERLVDATAEAAVCVARRKTVPAAVMPERALELAREILRGLAREKWKPDTALKLHKHLGKPGCVEQALRRAAMREHPEH
jgi:hypothetical protein